MSNTEALRNAAQNALDVLDEARTYTASESWSPSMTEECDRAIRLLRSALAQPAASGEPVAEVLIDSCADHESRIEAMDYLPAGTMLFRAPQPAPARVPPGWVLVPVEPTPEMLAVNAAPGEYVSIEAACILWRAMLAAAPDAGPNVRANRATPARSNDD